MSVLDDASNGSLAGSAFIQAGEKTYHAVKDALDLMGLPDAPHSAHLHMPNSNRIFLNDAGLVISFVYDHRSLFNRAASRLGLAEPKPSPLFTAARFKTDLILQPLFAKDLTECCRVEIIPGVPRASVTREDMKHHGVLLRADGLRFINPHPEIMGEIRDPDGGSLIVVANRRRVEARENPVLPVDGDVRQARIYGSLREKFAQAFESGESQEIQAVFAHCARINGLPDNDPNKILHAYWTDPDHLRTERQQEVFAAGARYAQYRPAA